MQHVGRLLDDPNVLITELEPTRFVPVQIAIDGVIAKANALGLGTPIGPRCT